MPSQRVTAAGDKRTHPHPQTLMRHVRVALAESDEELTLPQMLRLVERGMGMPVEDCLLAAPLLVDIERFSKNLVSGGLLRPSSWRK